MRNVAKVLSLVLATVMVLAVFPISAAGMNFSDVPKDKWFYGAVEYVYTKGLMTGTTDTTFAPTAKLTRGQFVTLLCRMDNGVPVIINKFKDVKSDAWYAGYVGWAATCGVVNGLTDNTFGPDNPMTREQMAAAMVRYIEYKGIKLPRENNAPYYFTDDDKVSTWATDYVDALRISGIVAGSGGAYNPKNTITRAETATIIMNLFNAIEKEWQGYVPNAEGDGFAVFGARYLYMGGSIVQGGLGTKLDESGEYPSLVAYTDENSEKLAYDGGDTVGISVSVAELDLNETPVVKVCFDGADGALQGLYNIDNDMASTYLSQEFTFVEGEADGGYRTAYYDLSKVHSGEKASYNNNLIHVLIKYAGEGLNIRYIGFFKTKADAENMNSGDYSDYLKNYFYYSNANIKTLDGETKEYYDELLVESIEKIVNSKSEITPESIKKNGGTCYYVSSINGDDSNDGLSPQTAWKTLRKVEEESVVIVAGRKWKNIKGGDGVFFERGSRFYTGHMNNQSASCFRMMDGVNYGAYGTGDKPRFSNAFDIEGKGLVWEKTEYANIWKITGFKDREDFTGENCEVGSIVFNDGEFVGLHVYSAESDKLSPYGDGKTTLYTGYLSADGKNYVNVGNTPCDNIGTMLLHNYEYYYDMADISVYLYWDGNNPAEDFDEILITRCGDGVIGGNDSNVDNLAFIGSGSCCVSTGVYNVLFTNCEVAYSGMNYASVATGIGNYGDTDNIHYDRCYIHDIEDGPMGCQSAGGKVTLQNLEFSNCVIVAAGNGVEVFNELGQIDESGVASNKIINVSCHDNIMAYVGWGFVQQEVNSPNDFGDVICGSVYGELVNCVFENNIIMYPNGDLISAYVATDTQPRGWQLRNNVYIVNPEYATYKFGFENINEINHYYSKKIRTRTPFNERYIRYYTSNGIDPSGAYYIYDDINVYEKSGSFYMTGWQIWH